jgi:hypothetical protein
MSTQFTPEFIKQEIIAIKSIPGTFGTRRYADALTKIERLQSRIAQLEVARQWVPVAMVLPDKDGQYIVSGISRSGQADVWECSYTAEAGWHTAYTVTAWMPMPEPYVQEVGA